MDMKRLLTSCFGLGWLPVAPGSWGSLPSAIIFGLVYYFGGSGVLAVSLMVVLYSGGFGCLREIFRRCGRRHGQ